jgi:hypothetical protein
MRLFGDFAASSCGVCVLLWGSLALAQDAATAGALFDKGVADMQAGRFDAACPALEESQQLDPHPGTLFTVAECQAKWGKLATAVAHYQDYIGVVSRLPADQQARHHARVETANAQVAKLKPSVPLLTLVLPANAPEGTAVSRDGVRLQGAALGVALPVNPGEHVIVTRAPGGQDFTTSVSLASGQSKQLDLTVKPAPVGPPVAAPAASAAPTPAPIEPVVPNPNRMGEHPHSNTPAYIIGGVGVAGVVVGSVAGFMVLGKKSTVSAQCTDHVCDAAGVDAANSGKTLGLVSDIAFGVGIAGLATSAILLLTQPKAESTAQAPRWQPLLASAPGGAWAGIGKRF